MLFYSYFQQYWHAQIKHANERAKRVSASGIVIFLEFDSIYSHYLFPFILLTLKSIYVTIRDLFVVFYYFVD